MAPDRCGVRGAMRRARGSRPGHARGVLAAVATAAAAAALVCCGGSSFVAAAEAAAGSGEVDCEDLGFSPGSLLCGSCDDMETFLGEVRQRSFAGHVRPAHTSAKHLMCVYLDICVHCADDIACIVDGHVARPKHGFNARSRACVCPWARVHPSSLRRRW